MKRQILSLLERDARITNADIAAVVGITEGEVARLVGEMEADGIIKGYKCVIDREKLEDDGNVSAIIELINPIKLKIPIKGTTAILAKMLNGARLLK